MPEWTRTSTKSFVDALLSWDTTASRKWEARPISTLPADPGSLPNAARKTLRQPDEADVA